MLLTAVESTTLATVAYDQDRQLLQLEFRSRSVYHYFGVPPAVHEALLEAPSVGRFFNRAIRGQYRFVRLADSQGGELSAGVPPQLRQGGELPWRAR